MPVHNFYRGIAKENTNSHSLFDIMAGALIPGKTTPKKGVKLGSIAKLWSLDDGIFCYKKRHIKLNQYVRICPIFCSFKNKIRGVF